MNVLVDVEMKSWSVRYGMLKFSMKNSKQKLKTGNKIYARFISRIWCKTVIITITAILCALLEIVDTTIVNVALNEMKGNLGATLSE